MISLDNAYLNFGATPAIQNCNFHIEQGERVALIGPSGSGKSSLLKTIASEHLLDRGSLKVNGLTPAVLNHTELKKLRTAIAYIPQDLALINNLKVIQNILLGKVGKQSTWKTLQQLLYTSRLQQETIFSILQDVGIPEKLFHRTDSLSGGQQQRVAIARALYQQATLILADEPVSSVDPSRAHSILQCLVSLSEQSNITLLCSLHNLEYAKTFFPRIIGMRRGEVIFDDQSHKFSEKDFKALYSLNEENTP